GRIDIAAGAGLEDLNLQSEATRRSRYLTQRGLGGGSIRRIDQHGDTSRFGHHLMQEPQSLSDNLAEKKIHASRVPAWLGKACNETKLDRVFGDAEHDGDRRGRSFGRERCGGGAGDGNDGHAAANEISHDRGQTVVAAVQPMVLDRYVLPFEIAGFL